MRHNRKGRGPLSLLSCPLYGGTQEGHMRGALMALADRRPRCSSGAAPRPDPEDPRPRGTCLAGLERGWQQQTGRRPPGDGRSQGSWRRAAAAAVAGACGGTWAGVPRRREKPAGSEPTEGAWVEANGGTRRTSCGCARAREVGAESAALGGDGDGRVTPTAAACRMGFPIQYNALRGTSGAPLPERVAAARGMGRFGAPADLGRQRFRAARSLVATVARR